MKEVKDDKIKKVMTSPKSIKGCYTNNICVRTSIQNQDTALMSTLIKHNVTISGQPNLSIWQLIKAWWPLLLFYFIFISLSILLLIGLISLARYRRKQSIGIDEFLAIV